MDQPEVTESPVKRGPGRPRKESQVDYSNVGRTHYVGDNCPGGHADEQAQTQMAAPESIEAKKEIVVPESNVTLPPFVYGVVRVVGSQHELAEIATEPIKAIERKNVLDAITPRSEGATYYTCKLTLAYESEWPNPPRKIKP